MHRAALEGHTAAVSLLLEQGADIKAKNNVSTQNFFATPGCRILYVLPAELIIVSDNNALYSLVLFV